MRDLATLIGGTLLALIGCTTNLSGSAMSITTQRGAVHSADGSHIVYDVRGAGPFTLILIHGWACDRSYWDQQIAPLSADFRVVTLDLAGHGESGATRNNWTIEAFGEDVAAVAHELDAQDIILIGHSMGGPVMLEAARRLPGRVRALIGVDTLKDPDEAISAEQAENLWAAFTQNFAQGVEGFVRTQFFLPQSDPQLVDHISKDMASAPQALSVSAGKALSVYDRRLPLSELSNLPLTLINAPQPPTQTDHYLGVHDNMTLIVMDQAGHFPMQEVPEQFNRIVRNTILRTP